jgi:hypothetical protein
LRWRDDVPTDIYDAGMLVLALVCAAAFGAIVVIIWFYRD